MSNEKKNLKTYTIEHYENENGEKVFSRTNNGFNPFELIGFCEITIRDIRNQMAGVVKADVIKRQIFEDKIIGQEKSKEDTKCNYPDCQCTVDCMDYKH